MKHIFLYDVHTHTNMDPLLKDVNNIISVCKHKNIIWNCVGTNYEDSCVAVEQARKYPGQIYATIGIHPDNCKDIHDIEKLEQLYLQNKDVIVAWGEIGLDYHVETKDVAAAWNTVGLDYRYENSNKEKQILFFKKQLELVNKYNLPVCIHVRKAEQDCIEILKMVKNPKKVWIHCFAMGSDWAKKYVDAGYMISIPGIVTFKNAKLLHESIKHIPLDRMMVETDGPFLAPEPYRGKINMPQYVEFVAQDIANKLQISKEELSKKLTANAVNFFKI